MPRLRRWGRPGFSLPTRQEHHENVRASQQHDGSQRDDYLIHDAKMKTTSRRAKLTSLPQRISACIGLRFAECSAVKMKLVLWDRYLVKSTIMVCYYAYLLFIAGISFLLCWFFKRRNLRFFSWWLGSFIVFGLLGSFIPWCSTPFQKFGFGSPIPFVV